MRMMMKVQIPCDTGNKAFKDGTLGKIIGQWMEHHKPEAAYFGPTGGDRAAYFVFDMKDSSEMVAVAEPFFSGLDAKIEIGPVMNPADLKAGTEKLKM